MKGCCIPGTRIAGSYDFLSVLLRTEVLFTLEAASFLDGQAISTLHLDYKSIWNDIIFHHSATLEIITSVLNHCWKTLWCRQDEYSLILLKGRVCEQVISIDAAPIIAPPCFLSSHYMGFYTVSRKHSRFSVWSQSLGKYFNIFFKTHFSYDIKMWYLD